VRREERRKGGEVRRGEERGEENRRIGGEERKCEVR
jgi:hypothetical protein